MKKASLDDLNKAFFSWFGQKWAQDITISGAILFQRQQFWMIHLILVWSLMPAMVFCNYTIFCPVCTVTMVYASHQCKMRGESGSDWIYKKFLEFCEWKWVNICTILMNPVSTIVIYCKNIFLLKMKTCSWRQKQQREMNILCTTNAARIHKLKLAIVGKQKIVWTKVFETQDSS